MTRPQLGEQIHAHDRLARCSVGQRNGDQVKSWVRYQDLLGPRIKRKRKPVDGIYVGYRQYQQGKSQWTGEEIVWIPSDHIEVWLVVESPGRKPIPVLPEDVEPPAPVEWPMRFSGSQIPIPGLSCRQPGEPCPTCGDES